MVIMLISSCDYLLLAWSSERPCRREAAQREIRRLDREDDSLNAVMKQDEMLYHSLWNDSRVFEEVDTVINTIPS